MPFSSSQSHYDYVPLSITSHSNGMAGCLLIHDIPDLLNIMVLLKKNDFLSSSFLREHGLKGFAQIGLLRKAVIMKLAFQIYKDTNPQIIQRILEVSEQSLGDFNLYIFSDKGIFWRKVEGNDSTELNVHRSLLDGMNEDNLLNLIKRKSLSFLFDLDYGFRVARQRERELLCEF